MIQRITDKCTLITIYFADSKYLYILLFCFTCPGEPLFAFLKPRTGQPPRTSSGSVAGPTHPSWSDSTRHGTNHCLVRTPLWRAPFFAASLGMCAILQASTRTTVVSASSEVLFKSGGDESSVYMKLPKTHMDSGRFCCFFSTNQWVWGPWERRSSRPTTESFHRVFHGQGRSWSVHVDRGFRGSQDKKFGRCP